jgi:hypothetical protein
VPAIDPSGRPDPSDELDLIESTERSEDPLGIDESTSDELDQAAARIPRPKQVTVLPSASRGAALSSIAGVRETKHLLDVKLAQGLAFVRMQSTLASSAKHAAELSYRLPLGSTAVVTELMVCAGKQCNQAAPQPAAPASTRAGQPTARALGSGPGIEARVIEDERGRALAVRIDAVAAGASVELVLSYVAEAKLLGGRVRFPIAARGYDPNLANTELRVDAPELRQVAPAQQLSIEPWVALEVSARWPEQGRARTTHVATAPCGVQPCTRRYEASAPGAAELRATWLLIDASPSMEGPARSRVSATVAALSTVLPEATDIRAFAFAARAAELGRFRAGDAPLVKLADATLLDLDAATHLSSAIAHQRQDLLRARPRLVVISDGLFDDTPEERQAVATLRKLGVETWLVALSDASPRLADAFAHVLHVAPLAEAALHGSELGPLEDALRSIAARVGAGGLRNGEQRTTEQKPRTPSPLHVGAPWLAFWSARDRQPSAWRALAAARLPGEAAAIPSIPYLSVEAPGPRQDTGLPQESVLSMLRTQLVPQARACLRVDRKGRGDYAVGLAFHALFAQREVYEARVEGHIEPALRSCLEAILPKLRVPSFTGRIRVRYPIYTEREPEPPVIELEADTERQLERAFSPSSALP